VDTGIDVVNNTAYVWGLAYYGISGGDAGVNDSEYNNYPPSAVEGLPVGGITEMSGQIYNFNAVDFEGCVWGWGSYAKRDGTGSVSGRSGTGGSWPPKKVKIGGKWNDTTKPDLCNVALLSATHSAGAAVTKDGYVYSWGDWLYGARGAEGGAYLVEGLPDPTLEGKKPIQLEGGYENYWVILEDGEVWYFGYSDGYERPAADEGGYEHSAGQSPSSSKAVIAMPSTALAPWFRYENPDEYIIQVHSGIYFGAALLSTGRVLTWGKEHAQALARLCTTAKSSQCDDQARSPAYADQPVDTKLVQLSCTFTAMVALSEDRVLYGWGASSPYVSYEYLPHYPMQPVKYGDGSPVTDAVRFQTGQGYFLWWTADGRLFSQGYNPRGSTGHRASMPDGDYDVPHEAWFAGEEFMGCTYTSMMSKGSGEKNTPPVYSGCGRLRQPWDGETGPEREYQYRFTMAQCIAWADFEWPYIVDPKTKKATFPSDGRKGLCA
jgi:alpha-tubulin suppressor-like RCC1 family protein